MNESAATRSAGRPKDLEKRHAIMGAAARLFMENGFERTTMDAIANAAGVSKLTVYSHFDDKDGLFRELIACKCNEYFEERDLAYLATLPPAEALKRLAGGFIGLVFHPDVMALYRLLMANATKETAQNRTFYETGPAPTLASISALLADYDRRGLLRVDNPDRAADHLLAMLQGCMHLRALLNIEPTPTAEAVQSQIDDAIAVFMRAYGPDATSEDGKPRRKPASRGTRAGKRR
jgi:TetR/AcrR family transcriptional repressor of mexJK operon